MLRVVLRFCLCVPADNRGRNPHLDRAALRAGERFGLAYTLGAFLRRAAVIEMQVRIADRELAARRRGARVHDHGKTVSEREGRSLQTTELVVRAIEVRRGAAGPQRLD